MKWLKKQKGSIMKKREIDTVELRRLKFEYYSECLWNRSVLIKKKISNKVYNTLKSRYGITGRNSDIVMQKINKLLK